MLKQRFILTIILIIITGALVSAVPTTLDVSQQFSYTNVAGQPISLPAVTPQSDPQQITDKFLGLIRYFNEQGINGTIFIPAGTWRITRTLHLSHMNYSLNRPLVTNIQGAGQKESILEGAPGFQEIPLLMLGDYLQEGAADLNALHHPYLTNIYDNSVTGRHYGLRTQSVPDGVTTEVGVWKAGTAYQAGQIVTLENPKSRYICYQQHTATDGADKPYSGNNWRGYWLQTNVTATGFVPASPLTAGPLDPDSNYTQATYWAKSEQFTLDLCVKNNGTLPMDGILAAVSNSEYASSARGTIWALAARGNNNLDFFIVVPTGIAGEIETGQTISARFGSPLGPGVHRISVQIDFRAPVRRLAAWVDGVQQSITVSGKSAASYQYPEGTRFLPYNSGAFIFGTGYRGQIAMQDQDWTYAGLKISNTERYAVRNIGDAQQTLAGAPPSDAQRFFTDDAQTIAFLPLQDTPPTDADYLNPMQSLVTIQHGQAATPPGKTPQRGFGYWLQNMGGYQPGAAVKDLTLRNPEGRYGAPFSVFVCYGVDMHNVTLEGGFNGFDNWAHGSNNYLLRLRNTQINNSSNAGICSVGQAMYLAEQLTINNAGRYAMFLPQSFGDWRKVTITPSAKCEYLICMPPDQSQAQVFTDITVLPEATHRAPSKAIFSIGFQLYGMTGGNKFFLQGFRAKDLPANIIFLELPDYQQGTNWPQGTITIEDVDFTVADGGKLAAFLCVDSPRWHGLIEGCNAKLGRSVTAWLDQSKALPWHEMPMGGYAVDDLVSYQGKNYRCIRNHGNWPFGNGLIGKHAPGAGENWQEYWQEYHGSNVILVHPDYPALPSSGYWVEGAHILRIPKANGGFTEYRCSKSGNAADPDPAKRPRWAVVK